MPRIRVLEINGDHIDVKKCKIEKGIVHLDKKTQKEFDSSQVFRIGAKKGNKIVLKRKACLLYNSGKEDFYSIEDTDKEALEGITFKDREKFVKRKIEESLSKTKPISNVMFLILIALLIIAIVLGIINLGRGPAIV